MGDTYHCGLSQGETNHLPSLRDTHYLDDWGGFGAWARQISSCNSRFITRISPRHLKASCLILVFSSDVTFHAKVRFSRRRSSTSILSSRVRGRGGGPGGGLGESHPATLPLTPPLPLPLPLPTPPSIVVGVVAVAAAATAATYCRDINSNSGKEKHPNIDIIGGTISINGMFPLYVL